MIHDVIHDTNSYTRLSSVIYRHKKRLKLLQFKPFHLILRHIQLYQVRYLVEMAGVEPASASTTPENTTCLDIVYYFNSLWPDEQGTNRDPLSLVQSPEAWLYTDLCACASVGFTDHKYSVKRTSCP